MKWNAELYDDKHAFVFHYGQNVLDVLEIKPGERILDLGCGTGHLTSEIQQLGGDVVGIDSSAEMIAQAKSIYPGIDFRVANGADFQFDKQFDAVFSNATLHWIHEADEVIKCVYNCLKPGGRFVAEMGGKDNMAIMIAATQKVLLKYGYKELAERQIWYFPSLGEYTGKLEAGGFRVTFATHFDRDTLLQDGRTGVGKWLNMFGQLFLEGIAESQKQQIINEITDLLEPDYQKDGNWYADYKRLRFIAVKK